LLVFFNYICGINEPGIDNTIPATLAELQLNSEPASSENSPVWWKAWEWIKHVGFLKTLAGDKLWMTGKALVCLFFYASSIFTFQ
jgi:hypothetical protein